MRKKNILVLYYSRGIYPLRDAIETHLYCWRRYGRHHAVYVNVAIGFKPEVLRDLAFDAVIFHTTYLSARWTREIFEKVVALTRFISEWKCVKIAIPQDEFMRTDLLCGFINDMGVTDVFTCAEPRDWPVIYRDIDRQRVRLRTVLTGYVDPKSAARIASFKHGRDRTIDIGYRAWRAEYWLGEHGLHKVRVAEACSDAAPIHNLKTDISLRDQDTLHGDAWLRFLADCVATVGVEGGASVLDRDGSIRLRTNEYVAQHPNASFVEVRDQCFPGQDGEINLMCISPRHLEACITETCQILVEGGFNGILIPGRHYLPLKSDYSNLDELLAKLRDRDAIRAMTKLAYKEVVASGKWSYPAFVRQIEQEVIEPAPPVACKDGSLAEKRKLLALAARDRWTWAIIAYEIWLRKGGRPRSLIARVQSRLKIELPPWI